MFVGDASKDGLFELSRFTIEQDNTIHKSKCIECIRALLHLLCYNIERGQVQLCNITCMMYLDQELGPSQSWGQFHSGIGFSC